MNKINDHFIYIFFVIIFFTFNVVVLLIGFKFVRIPVVT